MTMVLGEEVGREEEEEEVAVPWREFPFDTGNDDAAVVGGVTREISTAALSPKRKGPSGVSTR